MLANPRKSWSLHTLALQNAASAAYAGARTRERSSRVRPRESRRPIAEVLAQRESRTGAASGLQLAYPAETRGAESRSHPTLEGSRTLWSFVSLRCCQRAAACAVLRPPAWRGWRPALRSKTARPHRGPPPCGPRVCAVSGARARFKRSRNMLGAVQDKLVPGSHRVATAGMTGGPVCAPDTAAGSRTWLRGRLRGAAGAPLCAEIRLRAFFGH